MKEIKLGQIKKSKYSKYSHLVALVDDENYDFLMQWNWYALKDNNTFYAISNSPYQRMHRVVMSAKKGELYDHVNGNGLDNRRINLRRCSVSQNGMNRGKTGHLLSKYKGVSWHIRDKVWVVQIQKNNKSIYIGSFKSEIDAALAYNKKAKELFGEFAHLNVVPLVRYYQKPMLIPVI